jgi:prephenate dehydrogenase
MIEKVTIIGTGLIGTSIGLALHASSTDLTIAGFDTNSAERRTALELRAIDTELLSPEDVFAAAEQADLILLAVPVMAILDWMQLLSPILKPHQLLTDVGSTKTRIAALAATLYNGPTQARFLPGHPMAGKESGGAALAEAALLHGATWLLTPLADPISIEQEWRDLVARFGCQTLDLDPNRHDKICAWVSHLPQMVSTALAALLEDECSQTPEAAAEFLAIGGRALREMTRLGASPYSMWRDVALTNTEPLAATLFALEQRLAHLRENLRTPELRDEFSRANAFRSRPK